MVRRRQLLGDYTPEQMARLDPGLRQMAEEGMAISKKDYMNAALARGAYGSAMRQFMEKYDFLLTPQLATTAFDVGRLSPLDDDGNAWMAWTPFTVPFNLTQQPAASVPCGFSATACRWVFRSSAACSMTPACSRPAMPMN